MKNRTKLSFSQLQSEMEAQKQLLTNEKELSEISGGMSWDELVGMLETMNCRIDGSGNVYYETLPDVVVTSSYQDVYGMSWNEWKNQSGFLANLNNMYQGTDPSWQGYPNTYPGTGGGSSGIGSGSGSGPSVPTLLENVSGFGWTSKSYLVSQDDIYNVLSSTAAMNSWVNLTLSAAAGIGNTALGIITATLGALQGELIANIQDQVHHNNGENIIFNIRTNVTGDGTNMATTVSFTGESSGIVYGVITY